MTRRATHRDVRDSLFGLNALHETFGFQFANVPFGLSFHARHVQCIERIQPEAVGAVEQVEQLTVQLRHLAGVLGLPFLLEHDEVGAGEADAAVTHRLEQKNLRLVGVDLPSWRMSPFTKWSPIAPKSPPLTHPNRCA